MRLIAIEEQDFTCIPQICYELYFAKQDPGATLGAAKNIPLLEVSNDDWFKGTPYFQQLLLLLVRYQAIEWQRPIIYVAHTGGWFISKDGALIPLQR
jgi:apolipoprotein N-acyltransferase